MASSDPVAEGVRFTLALMAVSARTAPKAKGLDDVSIKVVEGEDLERLAEEMDKITRETGRDFFARDAENVRESLAVLLVGVKGSKPKGLNCGACGYPGCSALSQAEKAKRALDLVGPNCVIQVLDLGIAVGSAVKTAGLLNVDNRVMYTVGVAALRLGMIDADIALGVPLSATGKNIYFDRRAAPRR